MEKFDRPLFDWASEFVVEGNTVWDIGANVGLFTFAAASIAGPSGRVVAIEADTWLVDLLRRSTQCRAEQRAPVDILPVAVSKQVGIGELNIAMRGRVRNYIEDTEGRKSSGGVRKTHSVMTVTLDWLLEQLPPPDVLKIDVEGAEKRVLEGGRGVLSEVKPIILCEVGDDSAEVVSALLHSYGYKLFDLKKERRDREPLESAPFNTLAWPA